MGYLEDRIKEIEEEIAKTPKNKGTEKHLSKLKSKLALLREQQKTKSSKKGQGYSFSVKKEGDRTVAMVGYPSVGKSSLLNVLTNAKSEVGDYAFTTLTVIPGMMHYKKTYIQLLDLPGIIGGAAHGKGRGREILSAARVAELLLIVLDSTRWRSQLERIREELYNAGVRINKNKPDIRIVKRDRGGITVHLVGKYAFDEEDVKELLREYNIHNADIVIRSAGNLEDVSDAIIGNRVYLKALCVINKIDVVNPTVDEDCIKISTKTGEGIELLKERIWESLNIMRIYTKKQKEKADMEKPLILEKGSTVEDVVNALRLKGTFYYARVWGKSAKYEGQRVGIDHVLEDEDIVEIYMK